ncbi:MAG: hypothetical protein IJK81_13490 [Selenomonadaceae bacterium]|nr:hypothetical protein [Selenomonadaceae bacterium]
MDKKVLDRLIAIRDHAIEVAQTTASLETALEMIYIGRELCCIIHKTETENGNEKKGLP